MKSPPCARYEGGEDDKRVSNVWYFVAGLAGGGNELGESIARLYDYKGTLVVATRHDLPKSIQQMFRSAWANIGNEFQEHVEFVNVNSEQWGHYWSSRRFESDWKP